MAAHKQEGAPVVLVVEDEPILRLYAADWLEDEGFAVVDVPTAEVAIQMLEQRDDVRLVFADVALRGGMDGLKLAAQVSERWPQIRLVLTSSVFAPSYQNALPAGARFFGKPYRTGEVVLAMQKMLAD